MAYGRLDMVSSASPEERGEVKQLLMDIFKVFEIDPALVMAHKMERRIAMDMLLAWKAKQSSIHND
jgi:hypothetical protein